MPMPNRLAILGTGDSGRRPTSDSGGFTAGLGKGPPAQTLKGAVRLPWQVTPPLRGVTDIRFRCRDEDQYAANIAWFSSKKAVKLGGALAAKAQRIVPAAKIRHCFMPPMNASGPLLDRASSKGSISSGPRMSMSPRTSCRSPKMRL